MFRRLILFLVLLGGVLAAGLPAARAQTGYPMIVSVYPLGVQRGQSAEVTVTGAFNFAGAYAVLFEHPGLTAEIVAPNPAPAAGAAVNSVTLRVAAASGAMLGPQEFRIATPRGLSSVGLLVVGTEPESLEKEGNNTAAAANPLALPTVLNGRIQQNEDVDCFKFSVAAGEEVVFACLSARLQDKIHDLTPGGGGAHSDPILVLTDEAGRELAVADDHYGPDPLLAHRFEKAGAYVLQIRDVRYQGQQGWTYRLTCTRSPYLTALYPLAGERGKAVEVTPVGFNLGGMKQGVIEVPMRDPGEMDVQLRAGEGMTNPVPFVVSELPQTLESGDNDAPAGATPAGMPGGWNGRIESENDRDCFRFTGVQGQAYTFEVFARRCDSSLDAYLQVLNQQGQTLAANDDGEGKDSRLDWTCPAAGEYVLQVSDLHSRGGDNFVYHVAARAAQPDFSLICDDDKALIGPGGGYAMYVIGTRRNGFTGDIKLTVEGLPSGVTATADRVPADMTQACVILRAAADAKPGIARIRMWGTGEVKRPDGTVATLRRLVAAQQEIYFPGGGRGRYPVNTHVVSVTEPADVVLKLSANRADLKPGESVTIDVDVLRRAGFDKNVVLDVYLRHLGQKYGDPLPRGISLDEGASKTLLGPTENRGRIVLRATSDAPALKDLPIAVLGQVSINFVVKVSHASEPLLVSVTR
jgi:hypothetical protein